MVISHKIYHKLRCIFPKNLCRGEKVVVAACEDGVLFAFFEI